MRTLRKIERRARGPRAPGPGLSPIVAAAAVALAGAIFFPSLAGGGASEGARDRGGQIACPE